MSLIGMHNFARPNIADSVVRSIMVARSEEVFHAEVGIVDALSPAAAYDSAYSVMPWARYGAGAPALATDAIFAFEAGRLAAQEEEAERWAEESRYDDYFDNDWWEPSPMDCKEMAYFVSESDEAHAVWLQCEAMWREHESFDAPVFLRRVLH